jgi:hypothetical protein
MADTVNITRAKLYELDSNGDPVTGTPNSPMTVQFNPETLRVSFANQITPPNGGSGDQNSTSSTQFVGKGTTKLSVQLWFDVTGELPEGLATTGEERRDVRKLTQKVAYFITPQESKEDKSKLVPPGVRFQWGTFRFDGIMESLEESLEFFSPEGVPLRASLSLNLSQQTIQFKFAPSAGGPGAGAGGLKPPGTTPLAQAKAGMSLQAMASINGKGADWQSIAEANNIENPRQLQPGQLIDLNASVSIGSGGS